MKGRGSITIGMRISDIDFGLVKERAEKKGLTPTEWCKQAVIRVVHSASKVASTTKRLELYNPTVHKAGDRVLVRKGGKLVETVIPELDMDGNPIEPLYQDAANI